MSDSNLESKRFVPSGVDAQSWIGFEHRIQERRFKALVEAAGAAVARRDGVAARVALEEARELRPGAPELDALSARVALLPMAVPSAGSSSYVVYRALGAVAMFLVGIGLVMGIEQIRPGSSDPAPAATVAVADTSAPANVPSELVAPDGGGAEIPAVVDPPPVVTESPAPPREAAPAPPQVVAPSPANRTIAPAPNTRAAATPQPTAPTAVPNARREQPVGTAGPSRAAAEPRPIDVPNRPAVRPAAPEVAANSPGRTEPQTVQATREVSDDFVVPVTRNDNRPAFTEAPPPAPAIAASVMPQPVSITAPPPPAATVTAAAARADDTRVAQVLNQYARAYGRLDPTAARAVWPSVDERALTKAFASLESQDVSFDRCDIDVKGNQASASCRGTASYVGKVGSRQARTEPRQWNFELKLHGEDWKIEKAQALLAR